MNTHISDNASYMTTPSHKSDRSSGWWETEKNTFPKNSQTAVVRGSSSESDMILASLDTFEKRYPRLLKQSNLRCRRQLSRSRNYEGIDEAVGQSRKRDRRWGKK
jgi:hypothetical protein